MVYHYTLIRMSKETKQPKNPIIPSVYEDAEQLSYGVGENVKVSTASLQNRLAMFLKVGILLSRQPSYS